MLMDAAARLIAQNGVKGASVRAIARQAGVTEGAVYRHFSNKDELYLAAHARIIRKMAEVKQAIASRKIPIDRKLREWVRASYAFFDRHPDAFTFVLLTVHDLPEPQREVGRLCSNIFIEMVKRAQEGGALRPMRPELVLSHFSGLLLNVPRLINEGTLEGPASGYIEEVAEVVWDMLRPRT
jgi:AcrR family transcriptional regulator